MIKKLAPAIVLLLVCSFSTLAQNAKLNKANRLFCEMAYAEAKDLYIELLAETSDVPPEVYFNLGESYRLLDRPEEAARWYERSVTYTENSPHDYLYLAQMLQQMERYEEAKEWYSKYNDRMPNDSRGWRGMLATENYNRLLENPMRLEVTTVNGLNTPQSDMSPLYFRDGIVVEPDHVSQAAQ